MMKLAVVIGHNSVSQGAVRADSGMSEYTYNSKLAEIMASHASDYGIVTRVFRRVSGGSVTAEIERAYAEVDAWGCDASIELHFNGDAKAGGTETLASGTAKSLSLAQAVQDEVVSSLGLNDRGVKTRGRGKRGGLSLWSGKAPAILVEPFFNTNRADLEATNDPHEMDSLARAYLRGAERAMLSWPRKNIEESRTLQSVKKQKVAQVLTFTSGGAASVLIAIQETQAWVDMLPMIGPLATYVPYLNFILVALTIGATAWQRIESEAIKAFRKSDHEKGIS